MFDNFAPLDHNFLPRREGLNSRSFVHPLPEKRSLPQSLLWTPPESRVGRTVFQLVGSRLPQDLLVSMDVYLPGTSLSRKRRPQSNQLKRLRGWRLFDVSLNNFLTEFLSDSFCSCPFSTPRDHLTLLGLESFSSQWGCRMKGNNNTSKWLG